MPSLLAGYQPAEIPPPGEESHGYTGQADIAGEFRPTHQLIWSELPVAGTPLVPAPALRAPGVLREQYVNPAPAYFARNPRDGDNDESMSNPRGQHVAQVAGAKVARDKQAPEPPMYGSTWRMEPEPASAGWYVGG